MLSLCKPWMLSFGIHGGMCASQCRRFPLIHRSKAAPLLLEWEHKSEREEHATITAMMHPSFHLFILKTADSGAGNNVDDRCGM